MKPFYKPIFIFFITTTLVIGQSSKAISIEQFGAIGDGKTLNTKAIQKAIDKATSLKNGKVIFPKGNFLSGTIELKSGVEVHFEEDAVLLGTVDPYQYRKLTGNKALLIADNVSSFSITGKGTIDGQGRELALALDSLHHTKAFIDPNYNYKRMRPHEFHRVEIINFTRCKDVKVSGVTIQHGSSWVQTYEQCENLEIDNITVNSTDYWNNDGMDIVDCNNVRITNSFVNAADDGICLKSHSPDHINDQVLIANCKVRSSASAIKFGTASHGGFTNVIVKNIEVFDTFRSAIAIESVDGGVIENVLVSDINAVNTGNPIFIRLGHRSGEKPGSIKNITLKNITVQVPFSRPDIDYDLRGPEVNFFHNPFPSSIVGIPGHEIENVTLENITITYPGRASKGMAYVPLSRLQQVPEKKESYPEFSMFGELPAWGMYVRHAKGVTFKNINFKLEDVDFRPAFVFDDARNISLEGIHLPENKTQQVYLNNTASITIDTDLKLSKQMVNY